MLPICGSKLQGHLLQPNNYTKTGLLVRIPSCMIPGEQVLLGQTMEGMPGMWGIYLFSGPARTVRIDRGKVNKSGFGDWVAPILWLWYWKVLFLLFHIIRIGIEIPGVFVCVCVTHVNDLLAYELTVVFLWWLRTHPGSTTVLWLTRITVRNTTVGTGKCPIVKDLQSAPSLGIHP